MHWFYIWVMCIWMTLRFSFLRIVYESMRYFWLQYIGCIWWWWIIWYVNMDIQCRVHHCRSTFVFWWRHRSEYARRLCASVHVRKFLHATRNCTCIDSYAPRVCVLFFAYNSYKRRVDSRRCYLCDSIVDALFLGQRFVRVFWFSFGYWWNV